MDITVTTAEVAAPAGPVDAAALFDAHYVRLCRLAKVILGGDEHRAEELVMEAFVRTLVSWRGLRDADRAPAYLQRVLVNLARSALRRDAIERRVLAVVHGHDAVAAYGGDAGSQADADPILRAVAALPPRQRAAVVLRYYGDQSEVQIAQVLGCSAGTVKSQLAKARATLSRALAEEES